MMASSIPLERLKSVAERRHDFPGLALTLEGKPLTYLDSAASAQKPQQVIDAISDCYSSAYANIHRGSYFLADIATENFEKARRAIQLFINAGKPQEIVITGNATAALNLVARSWGARDMPLKKKRTVIISEMEHHSNIVPWLWLRDAHGVELRILPVEEDGALLPERLEPLLDDTVDLVAIAHVSNVLGTVSDGREFARLAHGAGAKILLDGSQAAPHLPIDVAALDADFYVFTGHKVYGPSGIGVLYAKEALLESMPPFMGGGEMISSVSFEKAQWAALPHKFEAGTPPIAQATGLHAALDYINDIGLETIAAHEQALFRKAEKALSTFENIRILGETPDKAPLISFAFEDFHAHDIATLMGASGIALRAGYHCAQPLLTRFGLTSSLRMSLGLYNNEEDIDRMIDALKSALQILRN